MSLSVTQFGKPLPKEKYTWDKKTKTFSTKEEHLIIDFNGNNGIFCTGNFCIFYTGSNCIFRTGSDCNFKTKSGCIFRTGSDCNFKTGRSCTFTTGHGCTFTTGADCVIIRRDVFEVIRIPKKTTIKLKYYKIKGFTKTIVVDGKTIEITNKGFEILKKSLLKE